MKKKSLSKSAILFLPLLVLYSIIILVFASADLVGDELRHMRYAENLTNGYYAETDNPEFRNGPGYPLVISPAVFFKAPYSSIKLLNAFFLFFAVLFFYRALLAYLKPTLALAISYIFGLYPVFLKWMVYLHSESLAIFLSCGFIYYFLKSNRLPFKRFNSILSAFFLGLLALTKIIFGYVVLATLVFYSVSYFFKKSKKIQRGIIVLLGSLAVCVPYLLYTYTLTGKVFLWGTGGGEILYWRSTPYTDEYGNWINSEIVLGNEEHDYIYSAPLRKNHGDFIRSLQDYSYVQRDSLFKKRAIENMRQYPVKYLENTLDSALRLFFNYPYSYTPQKTSSYVYILPNMFLVVFLISSLFLSIRYPYAVPFEVRFLGLIALLFVGGLTLLDGKIRHLVPIIPVLVFFIVFVHKQLVIVDIKDSSKISNGNEA